MSEFLARKIRTYFKTFDFDNDGFVSKKDAEAMADRYSDGLKVDAAEREKTTASFVNVWRQWMKSSGSDDNGLLTPSIMTESVKQQRNDPELKATFLALGHQIFKLLDVNGDGFLQEDEYAKAFALIGYKDTSLVRKAFQSIDLNKDGKLSYEEFTTALYEYFTSEDQSSPYTSLWGPLA